MYPGILIASRASVAMAPATIPLNNLFANRGNFELDIPYASSYVLKIVSPDIGEITVKLEIPKNKKPDSVHDIVIVKNKTGEFNAQHKDSF